MGMAHNPARAHRASCSKSFRIKMDVWWSRTFLIEPPWGRRNSKPTKTYTRETASISCFNFFFYLSLKANCDSYFIACKCVRFKNPTEWHHTFSVLVQGKRQLAIACHLACLHFPLARSVLTLSLCFWIIKSFYDNFDAYALQWYSHNGLTNAKKANRVAHSIQDRLILFSDGIVWMQNIVPFIRLVHYVIKCCFSFY